MCEEEEDMLVVFRVFGGCRILMVKVMINVVVVVSGGVVKEGKGIFKIVLVL